MQRIIQLCALLLACVSLAFGQAQSPSTRVTANYVKPATSAPSTCAPNTIVAVNGVIYLGKDDSTCAVIGTGSTITTASVLFAASQRALGRNSSGAGAGEEVTASQLLDWVGTTRGSVLIRGALGWQILAPDTAGKVLMSNGAGADPSYQTASGSAPAGSGSELQARLDASTVQAVTSSAINGSSVALGGAVDGSALLTLTSTSKGFLLPRMTATQRDAIASPTTGLLLYNNSSSSNALNIRAPWAGGTGWHTIPSASWLVTDPLLVDNDPNYRPATYQRIYTSGSTSNPNFSTHVGHAMLYTIANGQNDIGSVAKKTYLAYQTTVNKKGEGQAFVYGSTLNCWGGGDCISEDRTQNLFGGCLSGGDECQKWSRYVLHQSSLLQRTAITSIVTSATINTTTTQSITKNIAAQTVTVADSTGVAVGQWVIIGGGAPATSGYNEAEAVKVTAVAAGSISGIFVRSHASGVPVRPATVFVIGSSNSWGQGRYVVNLSATPYTTGTAAGANVGNTTEIAGTGTAWASNMVGGDANNPGMISFEADDVTASPFSACPSCLRVWHPIASVASGTSLNIYRRDQVGLAPYSGLATSAGNYTVRPGARVMSFDPITSDSAITVVLDYNTFTWQVGDSVECAHSNSFDVGGATWDLAMYSPGVTLREGLNIRNSGHRDFQTGLSVSSVGAAPGGFTTGIIVGGKTTGLRVNGGTNAILLGLEIGTGRIAWNAGAVGIGYSSANSGLSGQMTNSGFDGSLDFLGSNLSGDTTARAEWTGHLHLKDGANSRQPRLRIEGLAGRAYDIQTTGSPSNSLNLTGSQDGVTFANLMTWTQTGSAVNAFTVTNAATGNSPSFAATGSDTDISVTITPKGAGNTLFSVGSARLSNTAATYQISTDLFLGRKAAANWQLGAADAASPVAQTLSVQSVVAGTTNTAGANWTLKASAGTGTGVGGNFIFQTAPAGGSGTSQNSFSTSFTIQSNGVVVYRSFTHANLPTVVNGGVVYCSDCNLDSPCTSGGTGALAKGIAGAWVCN